MSGIVIQCMSAQLSCNTMPENAAWMIIWLWIIERWETSPFNDVLSMTCCPGLWCSITKGAAIRSRMHWLATCEKPVLWTADLQSHHSLLKTTTFGWDIPKLIAYVLHPPISMNFQVLRIIHLFILTYAIVSYFEVCWNIPVPWCFVKFCLSLL